MGLHIAATKAAIVEVSTRAAMLEGEGRGDMAEVTYDTLFQVLNALFSSAEEQAPGWPRVVLLLTEGGRRLALDALAPLRLGQLRLRTATLLDLPDITRINTLAEIHEAITAAIHVGAPRYNQGDIRGCCTVYWATGQALLAAQAARGFSGYARALGAIRQVHESDPPTRPLDQAGVDQYAWALRHAFDTALKVTG